MKNWISNCSPDSFYRNHARENLRLEYIASTNHFVPRFIHRSCNRRYTNSISHTTNGNSSTSSTSTTTAAGNDEKSPYEYYIFGGESPESQQQNHAGIGSMATQLMNDLWKIEVSEYDGVVSFIRQTVVGELSGCSASALCSLHGHLYIFGGMI